MTDLAPSADSPDPRSTLRSIVRGIRMRLETEGAAGLAGVARGRAAASPAEAPPSEMPAAELSQESPPTAELPSGGETSPEVRVAAALRRELAAQAPAAAQDLLDFGSPDIEGGVSREEALARIAAEVAECERCPELVANRTHTVPGQGNPHARLVFVGEGPGQEEDRQGLAFVGRAGELLTKMIESIGLTRSDVFICNIIKCRPPANRVPMPDEVANCSPYLARQLEILRPKVICALGGTAAKALLQTSDGITRLRGRFHPYRGAKLMPTFHPAYVLRNYTPDTRKKVYDDLLKVKAELGA